MKQHFFNLRATIVISCFVGLSSVVITSCSKKKSIIEQSQESLIAKTAIVDSRWEIASNPYNYLDSIGVIHNLTLEYIFNKTKKVKIDSVYSYAKEYYVKERGYASNFDNWNVSDAVQALKQNAVALNNDEDIESFEEVATWYGYDKKTTAYKTYITSLFAMMDNVVKFCEDNPEDKWITYIYTETINDIKLLEYIVINDNTLESDERDQFLRCSSVLRYSIVYWSDTNTNIAKIGDKKPWKILVRQVADALGTLVGATYCDTVGITAAVASGLSDIITRNY